VGRNRIRRLMREGGLWAKQRRRFGVTAKSDYEKPVAPNELDRYFFPASPNQAWVGDITYIPTRDGWLYLAVVIGRLVVGLGGGGLTPAAYTRTTLYAAIHASTCVPWGTTRWRRGNNDRTEYRVPGEPDPP